MNIYIYMHTNTNITPYTTIFNWLVVSTRLKNMSSSIGMMKFQSCSRKTTNQCISHHSATMASVTPPEPRTPGPWHCATWRRRLTQRGPRCVEWWRFNGGCGRPLVHLKYALKVEGVLYLPWFFPVWAQGV